MQGVSHSHSTAVVKAHPRCAASRVHESVENRPIGNHVTPVKHRFGFSERGCDTSTIKMVAPDNDRCFYLSLRNEFVDEKASFRSLAILEPAYARWQPLKGD